LLDILLAFHCITPLHLLQRFISAPAVGKWSSPVPEWVSEGFKYPIVKNRIVRYFGGCLFVLCLSVIALESISANNDDGQEECCYEIVFDRSTGDPTSASLLQIQSAHANCYGNCHKAGWLD
jgi:hypothetical protein